MVLRLVIISSCNLECESREISLVVVEFESPWVALTWCVFFIYKKFEHEIEVANKNLKVFECRAFMHKDQTLFQIRQKHILYENEEFG